METEATATAGHIPTDNEIKLVIAASSAGTIFEWYDFFIYGTLAALIGAAFFPGDNPTLQLLLVWAGFAIGFGFRPVGAILFGYLGDRLGRKYTFLVTVTLMGIATAGVGFVPDAETIGLAAPLIIIVFRIIQGLALGGEYGGAAIYVAEHAPDHKRGFFTSFIQSSVVGGFVLSILVVVLCRWIIPADDFARWGWRVPFILSIVLLAISLWMRFKLSESPVFRAMKEAGETAKNPFTESFTFPGNGKRLVVAFFITGTMTVLWYSAFFQSLSFLRGPMHIEERVVEYMMFAGGLISMGFYIVVGKWSDKVGRKLPIILGGGLALALLFPVFHGMGALANPGLARAAAASPVVVSGADCRTNPFAGLTGSRQSACGGILETLTENGVAYTVMPADRLGITVGGQAVPLEAAWLGDNTARRAGLRAALTARGFDLSTHVPPLGNSIGIVALLAVMGMLSALTYGSLAAVLTEMFPPAIRYSSMSIPYHFAAGYLGGFLPLVAGVIVAQSGDIYSGLWYPWVIVAVGTLVGFFGLRDGKPATFTERRRQDAVA